MQNSVSSILTKQSQRYVFTRIYGKNLPKIKTRYSTHFDIFPLIAHAAGFSIRDGKLGLGLNPFEIAQQNSQKRLALLNYIGLVNFASYQKLWALPEKQS